jgi:hypothetical protein
MIHSLKATTIHQTTLLIFPIPNLQTSSDVKPLKILYIEKNQKLLRTWGKSARERINLSAAACSPIALSVVSFEILNRE